MSAARINVAEGHETRIYVLFRDKSTCYKNPQDIMIDGAAISFWHVRPSDNLHEYVATTREYKVVSGPPEIFHGRKEENE